MPITPLREKTPTKPERKAEKAPRTIATTGAAGLGSVLLLFVFHHLGIDISIALGIVLMTGLAYSNGANDVSKAIATLVGSGVSHYRPAIFYGSFCTVVGACSSSLLAAGLVRTFTSGLLVGSLHLTAAFALAAVVGAIAWVYLATRLALPVSTTHAITGAVVTTGVLAFGFKHIAWGNLVTKILLPLLLSPVFAFMVGFGLFWCLRRAFPQTHLSGMHWLSSSIASFARGLNDTPKIVALGATFLVLQGQIQAVPLWLFLLTACAMGVGSLFGGLRVTRTLAERVTKMDHREGLAANLTTALLVGLSSPLSLPVSTTHVSSCAIIGIGMRKGAGNIQWHTVREIALAWIVTLPGAGLLSLLAYLTLNIILH
jgi:inorganic phosphate transporter, PiT family